MYRFLWTAMATLMLASSTWADEQPARTPDRTITVQGTAEVDVPPDQAQITLAVQSFNKEILEAKKENDTKISKVLAVFKELKLASSDYCTTDISVNPEYATNEVGEYRKDKLLGYSVSNQLSVTLKDMSKLSALIFNSLQAGANQVESLAFETSKLRETRDEGRRQAIRAAREKAALIAAEIGQKIGKARTINEGSSDDRGSNYQGGLGGGRFIGSRSDSDSIEVIASGQLKVRAMVWVTFDLE